MKLEIILAPYLEGSIGSSALKIWLYFERSFEALLRRKQWGLRNASDFGWITHKHLKICQLPNRHLGNGWNFGWHSHFFRSFAFSKCIALDRVRIFLVGVFVPSFKKILRKKTTRWWKNKSLMMMSDWPESEAIERRGQLSRKAANCGSSEDFGKKERWKRARKLSRSLTF